MIQISWALRNGKEMKMLTKERTQIDLSFGVVLELLAYLVMEKLSALTRLTFHQLKNYAKGHIDLCSFFREHFHLFTIPQSP